jgi:hypothetical protein
MLKTPNSRRPPLASFLTKFEEVEEDDTGNNIHKDMYATKEDDSTSGRQLKQTKKLKQSKRRNCTVYTKLSRSTN